MLRAFDVGGCVDVDFVEDDEEEEEGEGAEEEERLDKVKEVSWVGELVLEPRASKPPNGCRRRMGRK